VKAQILDPCQNTLRDGPKFVPLKPVKSKLHWPRSASAFPFRKFNLRARSPFRCWTDGRFRPHLVVIAVIGLKAANWRFVRAADLRGAHTELLQLAQTQCLVTAVGRSVRESWAAQRLRDGVKLGPALSWWQHCPQSAKSRPASASQGKADIIGGDRWYVLMTHCRPSLIRREMAPKSGASPSRPRARLPSLAGIVACAMLEIAQA